MRLLHSLALGASCALWVGTMALTAPQPTVQGQAHPTRPVVQEDEPGWDCTTMGNRVCGPTQVRVWPKGGVDVGRPELGTEVLVNGRPWVVTVTGLEPVGAN